MNDHEIKRDVKEVDTGNSSAECHEDMPVGAKGNMNQEPATKVVFDSDGWVYNNLKTERSTQHVELSHPESGAQFAVTVESGNGPGYAARMRFTHPIPPKIRTRLASWLKDIKEIYMEHLKGVPPLPKIQNNVLVMDLEISSSPKSGHVTVQSTMNLGGALKPSLTVGGLHGSIEVVARGETMPYFLISNDAIQKVDAVSIHRLPWDGTCEAFAMLRTANGTLRSEGIAFNRLAPSCGDITLPLDFPGGKLSIPVPNNDEYSDITDWGNNVMAVYNTGVMASVSGIVRDGIWSPKYKCIKHLLTFCGAGTFCIAAIIIVTGATVGTGGAVAPGLVPAVAGCFGMQAMTILHLMAYHMGWTAF